MDPLVVCYGRQGESPGGQPDEPSVRCTPDGGVILKLVGGATVRVSRRRVVVVPPHPGGQPAPRIGGAAPLTARARAAQAWLPSRTLDADAGQPDVLMARGRIHASYQGTIGLFDRLREPLVESFATDDPLRRAFLDLVEEIGPQRPGCRAMVEALLRRCLVLFLRRLRDRHPQRLAWLAPLEDSRLGRVVTAMQDRPEHSFTLPALAEVAGMSRSVFAARFAGALGQPPIEFLKTLRLTRAAQLLLATDLPVKSVAGRVGYSSRSSFTRAFVACHGVGPMAFRAAARERSMPA